MTATISTSEAVIKELYPDGVPDVNYKGNTSWAMTDRDTKWTGGKSIVALQTEVPQGIGAQFDIAQDGVAPSSYKKFEVERLEYFGVARVKGQALKAVVKSGDGGALTNLWENEIKGLSFGVMRMLAIFQYRSGTGSLGSIASGQGTVTVTLATSVTGQPSSDVSNFCVGMRVQATDTDGGTLRDSGDYVTITGVNRSVGTLTAGVAWSTTISGLLAGDFLLRRGDNNLVPKGYAAWIPDTATPGTLHGLDRNSDPLKLAGQVLDCADMPMHEALIEAQARVSELGGDPDEIFCHPRDIAKLKKQIDAKVHYEKADVKSKIAGLSFRGIELEGDQSTLKVLGDINCPRGSFVMRQSNSWKIHSLGESVQILDFDENEFLRVSNADAYEVRVGGYLENECNAPAYTIRGKNFGT
jgi:hypothetical protein